jgi:hypothetical protein
MRTVFLPLHGCAFIFGMPGPPSVQRVEGTLCPRPTDWRPSEGPPDAPPPPGGSRSLQGQGQGHLKDGLLRRGGLLHELHRQPGTLEALDVRPDLAWGTPRCYGPLSRLDNATP